MDFKNKAAVFQRQTDKIYRLKVPFEDLYTSVFLIQANMKYILVDCASNADDVDKWIEPALKSLGITFSDISCVIATHSHSDHIGGLERILQKNPKIRVVRALSGMTDLEIYPMSGHALNCIGVLELQSGTLISADGLQGAGVGKYRCSLESKEDYLQTIERIKQDERIKNILFSHAYEPWYTDSVFGRENVEKALENCKSYI